MLITELGLRPCLIEQSELQNKLDLQMIGKIQNHIAQKQYVKRKKKKLKTILDKIDVAI